MLSVVVIIHMGLVRGWLLSVHLGGELRPRNSTAMCRVSTHAATCSGWSAAACAAGLVVHQIESLCSCFGSIQRPSGMHDSN